MRESTVPTELQSLYSQEDELRRKRNELCGVGGTKQLMIDNSLAEVRAQIRRLEGKPPYA